MGFEPTTLELAVLLAGFALAFMRWPGGAEVGVARTKTTTRHRSSRTLDRLLEEQAALAKKVSGQKFVEDYRKHLVGEGLQPKTIKGTTQVVAQFFDHLKAKGKKWYQANSKLLDGFLDREKRVCTTGRAFVKTGESLHDSTRHKEERTVMGAFEWACGVGEKLHVNPFAGRRRMKRPAHAQRFVERTDVRKLMDAAGQEDQRMLVMLSLAFWAAFRVGGIADARCEDVAWRSREIAVRGKGDGGAITGWIPIAPPLAEVLGPWMATRPRSGPLIPSQRHPSRHICAARVSALMSRFMKEHGVAESAHGLRHAAADEIDAVSDNPRVPQRLLLHKHLQTTEQWYLGRRSLEALRAAMVARSSLEHDLPTGAPRAIGETSHFPGLGERHGGDRHRVLGAGEHHETLRSVPNSDST